MAGYGIGSTLPGSSFLYDPLNTPDPPPWVEAELEHVIVETGFVGFLLTIAVRLLVPFELYRSLRLFPRSAARPLVAAALLFVLINLPMQIIVSRTAGIMYWFMAGVAFLPGSWAMMAAQEQVARLRQTSTLPAVSAARSV
jgi:O-antigen ligase